MSCFTLKNTLFFLANRLMPMLHNRGNKQGQGPFPSSDTLIYPFSSCLTSKMLGSAFISVQYQYEAVLNRLLNIESRLRIYRALIL